MGSGLVLPGGLRGWVSEFWEVAPSWRAQGRTYAYSSAVAGMQNWTPPSRRGPPTDLDCDRNKSLPETTQLWKGKAKSYLFRN